MKGSSDGLVCAKFVKSGSDPCEVMYALRSGRFNFATHFDPCGIFGISAGLVPSCIFPLVMTS